MENKNIKISALAAFGLVAASMGSAYAGCTPPTSTQVESLYSQLDAAHQEMFDSLNCESQNEAIQMASCKGKNSCKGMNSCKSAQNSCKGQGSCKGTSMGPFKDKNEAVELANKRMQAMSNGE
jgi:hypothetical protein